LLRKVAESGDVVLPTPPLFQQQKNVSLLLAKLAVLTKYVMNQVNKFYVTYIPGNGNYTL
jgi:hypothetical protein